MNFRVTEIFGPTVQGEGALAGLTTHFVRFAGCDYRCSWCDSLHAVLPEHVALAEKLDAAEIVERLLALEGMPSWVTFSGGNPALFDLRVLVGLLHRRDFQIAVETQGSIWKEWLGDVDHLVVSPKPPSSGMLTDDHQEQTAKFMRKAQLVVSHQHRSLKVVVFDDDDLDFARGLVHRYPGWPFFLSAGTDPLDGPLHEGADAMLPGGHQHEVTLSALADRYRWLCEEVSHDSAFTDARVLPQLHVVAFGHKVGV